MKSIGRIFIGPVPCALTCAAIVLGMMPGESQAQGRLRARLQERFSAASVSKTGSGAAQPVDGGRRLGLGAWRNKKRTTSATLETIGGVRVAVWQPPEKSEPAPLVLFSHGFHGMSTQSDYIMSALAKNGYFVMAPNHADAITNGNFGPPQEKFTKPALWSERTYEDRFADLENLLAAVKSDEKWNKKVDTSRLVLIGHSLGGYTVLALAGAWPSRKLPDVKAVVALSPYLSPFIQKGTLANLNVPVMYQCGTRDPGVTPFLVGNTGAFKCTSSPAYLVEFQDANHFTWTGLNREQSKEDLINYYCLAFLDKFVRGNQNARPETQLKGVSLLQTK